MKYLPGFASANLALSRSAEVASGLGCGRSPADITCYWFGAQVHGGAWALAVPEAHSRFLSADERLTLETAAGGAAGEDVILYAAPNGLADNSGSAGSPKNLTAALAALVDYGELRLADGIYTVDAPSNAPLNLGAAGARIKAANGARPVITNTDGTPPRVHVVSGTQLSGLWLGGAKDPTEKPVTMGAGCVLEDCVLWGYYGGIVEGSGKNNTYRRCKFIDCGTGTFYHSVYLSSQGAGTVFDECQFFGGRAYHLHLWHDPLNITIRRCFSADAQYCLVFNGNNHLAENNVWWNPAALGYPINMSTGAGRIYRRNFHGPLKVGSMLNGHRDWFGSWTFQDGITASANTYMQFAESDPQAQQVASGEEVALLGQSASAIDAAVAALEAAFAQSVATIHADATIEPAFALLAGVVQTWAAA